MHAMQVLSSGPECPCKPNSETHHSLKRGVDCPAVIGREGDKDTSGYISGDTERFSSEIYFLTELL